MATVSFRVNDELKRELDELSAEKGINLSKLFRQALENIKDDLLFGSHERAGLQLTLKDRLLLSNQYRVLELLDPDAGGTHRRHRDIVEHGYEIHYRSLADDFNADLNLDLCREVLDVLDMYAALTLSYRHAGDVSGIDEAGIRFEGFSSDFEDEMLAYARYFILKLDRYPALRDGAAGNFLSTGPMLDIYRRMLKVWTEIGRDRLLTGAEIARIVDARFWRRAPARVDAAFEEASSD